MTDAEYLNTLCSEIRRAECLNALHACREGHPLGRDDAFKWRNADSMVKQQRVILASREYRLAEVWLEKKAKKEWEAAA